MKGRRQTGACGPCTNWSPTTAWVTRRSWSYMANSTSNWILVPCLLAVRISLKTTCIRLLERSSSLRAYRRFSYVAVNGMSCLRYSKHLVAYWQKLHQGPWFITTCSNRAFTSIGQRCCHRFQMSRHVCDFLLMLRCCDTGTLPLPREKDAFSWSRKSCYFLEHVRNVTMRLYRSCTIVKWWKRWEIIKKVLFP